MWLKWWYGWFWESKAKILRILRKTEADWSYCIERKNLGMKELGTGQQKLGEGILNCNSCFSSHCPACIIAYITEKKIVLPAQHQTDGGKMAECALAYLGWRVDNNRFSGILAGSWEFPSSCHPLQTSKGKGGSSKGGFAYCGKWYKEWLIPTKELKNLNLEVNPSTLYQIKVNLWTRT